MLRDASSLRIRLIAVVNNFAEPLVDGEKVQLHSANGVIDYELITLNDVHRVVYTAYVQAYGLLAIFETFLAFFKSLLTCLQLSNIRDNLVPDRTGVVESLIHLLFKTLKSIVHLRDVRIQIFDGCEDFAVVSVLW